ncbi:hypothetical protein [Bifidobacterium sp. ESL0800]|uniref:hypothetical protein n=1 Tax=Bifidobacterium sp. ESL0800 TaxID=2983236 RepID=UPI0023F91181|nr:hypothetical protein [Bifidobacterium sp. ESL0800]WEV75637.1 hypothetical protein OZX75_08510 [Bifidobacterium sp. ESL0800]
MAWVDRSIVGYAVGPVKDTAFAKSVFAILRFTLYDSISTTTVSSINRKIDLNVYIDTERPDLYVSLYVRIQRPRTWLSAS